MLQTEYIKLRNDQDIASAAQYHQPLGLNFDPAMGTAPTLLEGLNMDTYLCDTGPVYTM